MASRDVSDELSRFMKGGITGSAIDAAKALESLKARGLEGIFPMPPAILQIPDDDGNLQTVAIAQVAVATMTTDLQEEIIERIISRLTPVLASLLERAQRSQ